jgi:hypothetical protein
MMRLGRRGFAWSVSGGGSVAGPLAAAVSAPVSRDAATSNCGVRAGGFEQDALDQKNTNIKPRCRNSGPFGTLIN